MISGSQRSSGEGIGYPLQYSWASRVDQLVKNLPEMPETWVGSLGWEDPDSLEKGKATHSTVLEFPCGSAGKESTCNAGDLGSILSWEDPLEKGMATHSSTVAWTIPVDRDAWRATVLRVAKSRTQLSS